MAVVLSAQATDKSVNLATREALPGREHAGGHRWRSARTGSGLHHAPSASIRTKAKNVIALSRHAAREARRRGAAHARGARGAARRGPQDRQRGAQRRLRRADDGRGHPHLPRRRTAPASRRARTRWRSEGSCSRWCRPSSACTRTTGSSCTGATRASRGSPAAASAASTARADGRTRRSSPRRPAPKRSTPAEMSLFNPSRDQAREFFFALWAKSLAGRAPHAARVDGARDRDGAPGVPPRSRRPRALARPRPGTPEGGETNPFLHLSLHLAIDEQVSIDQPPGIREAVRRLAARHDSEHEARHAVMDCLAEIVWQAQRNGVALRQRRLPRLPRGEAPARCLTPRGVRQRGPCAPPRPSGRRRRRPPPRSRRVCAACRSPAARAAGRGTWRGSARRSRSTCRRSCRSSRGG